MESSESSPPDGAESPLRNSDVTSPCICEAALFLSVQFNRGHQIGLEALPPLQSRLPGAGHAFAAVPSVAPFSATGAGLMQVIQNARGVTGSPLLHIHHRGRGCGVAMQLGERSRHHIQVCPNFGRATVAHDEVKTPLSICLWRVASPRKRRTEVCLHGVVATSTSTSCSLTC